jgi:hypothetical protein
VKLKMVLLYVMLLLKLKSCMTIFLFDMAYIVLRVMHRFSSLFSTTSLVNLKEKYNRYQMCYHI